MNKPILVGLTVALITFVWNIFAALSGFNINPMNFIIIRFFETFTVTVITYWVLDFAVDASFKKQRIIFRTLSVAGLVWLIEASPFFTLQSIAYWLLVVGISQLMWDEIGKGRT